VSDNSNPEKTDTSEVIVSISRNLQSPRFTNGDWRFLDMDTITSDVSVFSGLELSDTLTLNW
jgi:hypothetical protein